MIRLLDLVGQLLVEVLLVLEMPERLVLLLRRLGLVLQMVGQGLAPPLLEEQLVRRLVHLLPGHVQGLLHLVGGVAHKVWVAVLAQALLHEDLRG